MSSTRVLILAGGKGSRMGADVPKAMIPICGKPIIDHLLDTVAESGVDERPAVVVGHDLDKLVSHIEDRSEIVIQEEQRGTGHAVMVAEGQLKDAGTVLVVYGDHGLYAPSDFKDIVAKHEGSGATITLLTTVLPDYEGWRAVFTHFGRILRQESGELEAIREYKLCSDEEKAVKEVNNGMYCFDGAWLWENIQNISDQNAKNEYLLTDLIEMAQAQGKTIQTSECAPECGIGVNTPEEVEIAERVLCGTGTQS